MQGASYLTLHQGLPQGDSNEPWSGGGLDLLHVQLALWVRVRV